MHRKFYTCCSSPWNLEFPPLTLFVFIYFPTMDGFQVSRGFIESIRGLELSVEEDDHLLKILVAVFTFSIIQLMAFCYLRPILSSLYQPRCLYVPRNERVEAPGNGLFQWIIPTLRPLLLQYLSSGLDSYFFLRFIVFLLCLFIICGAINMTVLIPVHVWGSQGMDITSILQRTTITVNTSKHPYPLHLHFICTLVTIILFKFMLVKEIESVIQIRHAFMESSPYKCQISSRVILFSLVPHNMREYTVLVSLFSVFPGGVEKIWFVDNFLLNANDLALVKKAFRTLESLETRDILKPEKQLLTNLPFCLSVDLIRLLNLDIKTKILLVLPFRPLPYDVTFRKQLLDRLQLISDRLEKEKIRYLQDKAEKIDKVFIRFRYHTSARMAYQSLLLASTKHFEKAVADVNPDDIIWNNLLRRDGVLVKFKLLLIDILLISVILLHVLPVALVGLFSHSMSRILLCVRGINNLPGELRQIFSGFLPSLMLNVLTATQLRLIKSLLIRHNVWTGSELQLLSQEWYFSILFIHQFLVVSISSSFTSMLFQIVEHPTRIPAILSVNLPSGVAFFYRHLIITALTLCSSNFLQLGSLVRISMRALFVISTPRQVFMLLTTLPRVQWGLAYPVVTVHGIVGLTYCVIAPPIVALVISGLSVLLFYYKYALQFVYDRCNPSETYGKLYLRALMQLYWGVYCLEFCMVSIIFRKAVGEDELCSKLQCLTIVAAFLLSITFHRSISERYSKHFTCSPINSTSICAPCHTLKQPDVLEDNLMYCHPSYKWQMPSVWLPQDEQGASDHAIEAIYLLTSGNLEVSTSGARLLGDKWSRRVRILRGPP